MYSKFKQETKKRNNKNFTFVKIKADRFCHKCGKHLIKGTECLTVNPKGSSRRWICEECVIKITNLIDARMFKASIAFGDEGGYMAALDWEAECEAECGESGCFDDSNLDDYFGEE